MSESLYWAKPQLVESISIVNITTAQQFNIKPLIWVSTGSRYSKLIKRPIITHSRKSSLIIHISFFDFEWLPQFKSNDALFPKFHTFTTRLTSTSFVFDLITHLKASPYQNSFDPSELHHPFRLRRLFSRSLLGRGQLFTVSKPILKRLLQSQINTSINTFNCEDFSME